MSKASTEQCPEGTLMVTRVFKAPMEAVFRAWLDPKVLKNWWGPQGCSCESVKVEEKVGGRYRLEIQPPEGEPLVVAGEYLEIAPMERLRFTWAWEKGPHAGRPKQTVTVDLSEVSEGTKLTLTHSNCSDSAERDALTEGWKSSLESLSAAF